MSEVPNSEESIKQEAIYKQEAKIEDIISKPNYSKEEAARAMWIWDLLRKDATGPKDLDQSTVYQKVRQTLEPVEDYFNNLVADLTEQLAREGKGRSLEEFTSTAQLSRWDMVERLRLKSQRSKSGKIICKEVSKAIENITPEGSHDRKTTIQFNKDGEIKSIRSDKLSADFEVLGLEGARAKLVLEKQDDLYLVTATGFPARSYDVGLDGKLIARHAGKFPYSFGLVLDLFLGEALTREQHAHLSPQAHAVA